MSSCVNCIFGVEKKGYCYSNKVWISKEDAVFNCKLKQGDFSRRYVCSDYKQEKSLKNLHFCINCDKDTLEKEWMCSECLCDSPDSELL